MTPRELRQQIIAAQYDWTRVLTPAQLAIAIDPETHGGYTTLGAWLDDGSSDRHAAALYAVPHVSKLLRHA